VLAASSISLVLAAYRPERAALLNLLAGLDPEGWDRPTECPAYRVKGVTTHVLGDDLSLLSRQRDGARDGLSQLAQELSGADFRTLLDTFNDRWVATASFLSTPMVTELLRLTGEWTASYYESVDPEAPGEAVGIFGAKRGSSSPLWHAIAREYLERWVHHSQIRRALGFGSLADRQFLEVGVEVVAAIGRVEPAIPPHLDGDWSLGAVVLGPAQQAADILTRRHTVAEIEQLVRGPAGGISLLGALAAR
jgi:uncharacterized protein (TIGR03083 family)